MSTSQTPEEQLIPEWFRDELNDHADASYSEEDYKQDFIAGAEWGFERAASKLSQKAAPGMREHAITFSKWLNNSWYTPHYSKWIHLREGLAGMRTSEELYDIFDNETRSMLPKPIEIDAGINAVCGCGRTLVPVFNKSGKRTGVTHETIEDEEYHSEYFRSLVATPFKPIEEEKPEQGCTKPNCDCIDRAEEHAGGPVKSYPCLHPGRELNEAKKPASPSPTEVPEEIGGLAQDFHPEHVEFLGLMVGIDKKKALSIADFIERQNQKIAAIRHERIAVLEASLASITAERDVYRKMLETLRERGSGIAENGKYYSPTALWINDLLVKYPSPTNTEQK